MLEEEKPSQREEYEAHDRQLIASMEEDFNAGFGKVVEAYWRELYLWAYKLLEGSGLAYLSEDAVQEAFLSAYKDLLRNRQKLSNLYLQHWLFAIVRQKSIECLRQESRNVYLAGLLGWENSGEDMAGRRLAGPIYDPALYVECRETLSEARITVIQLLANLSETQREVIVLKYFSPDGLELEEMNSWRIAERLNRPPGTIRSDISRAMQHMRKQLTKQQEGDKVIGKK